MFGMGFFEIVVIVIVAIIFLGPDKLPQAIVDVVKFLKVARKTIHDAKQTLDNELHISALQKEASNYHEHFNAQVDSITKDMQLKEIDDLFSEYKALPASVNPQNPAAIDSVVDSGAAGEIVVRESTPESTPKKNVKSTKSSKADRVKSSKSTKSSEPAKTSSSKLLKSPKLTKSPESTHQESLAESKALAKAAKSPASSVSKTHSPKSRAKSRTKS